MSVANKRLDAADIFEALESEIAYVPGGRDRENRPLIVLDVPAGEPTATTRSYLDSLIPYFLSIFSEETKSNGLALLVDARASTCRSTRAYIRQTRELVGDRAGLQLLAVRPDNFWDKQRVDNYCTKSHRDEEPIYVPLSRLSAYVDPNQLTYNLGGSKLYDHTAWIQDRLRIDEFINDAENVISKLSEQKERLTNGEYISSKSDESSISSKEYNLDVAAQRIFQKGRNLVCAMSRESAQDVLDTVKKIHNLIDFIEQKQLEIERAWSDVDRNIDILRDIENLEEGVASVTNWILGPADSMLNAHYQIGFDVASSEELRREHEKLELECRETYGKYAELLHKIDSIPSDYLSEDLKSQRDFMDFVCRSFATRLERRRNVLITSQRFFRLVSEYFDKTSEVFDKLIMGNRTCDLSLAGINLLELECYQQKLEGLERELVKEGEKLSDVLSMPVKDALCRDVQIDYSEDIINIQDILDATNARKNIFNDSVELQKLTLKQTALIYTYESDAEQAVQWLNDLFDVLVGSHVEIGCNVGEIQMQKQEHQSFQDTARGTYEYGCQLVNGARALRISCKLDLQANAALMLRLRQVWRQLRSVGQEQLTRLRVCAVFHRNVDDHCAKLREMVEAMGSLGPRRSRSSTPEATATTSASPSDGSSSPSASLARTPRLDIRDVLGKRERLLPEVGRTVRLGRLLRSRLKEPLAHQRMPEIDETTETGGNLSAVQSISAKLLEVTRLAEKLDAKLYEAGARSKALNPAVEEQEEDQTDCHAKDKDPEVKVEVTAAEDTSPVENKECRFEEAASEEQKPSSRASERIEDSLGEEYVTATECSVTPVPRSRSESFLSSDCEDGPVPSTCHAAEDETIERHLETKNEAGALNPIDEEAIEYSPDKASVIQRTIREKDGKIIKETTETTTLRVTHSTHFGVASYKLVSNSITDHTDSLDYRELQDLSRTVLEGRTSTPVLDTHREEHTYNSENGLVNYMKSDARGIPNGLIEESKSIELETAASVETTSDDKELLEKLRTVSEEDRTPLQPREPVQQQQRQQQLVACASALVEEFATMPTAIALCELT